MSVEPYCGILHGREKIVQIMRFGPVVNTIEPLHVAGAKNDLPFLVRFGSKTGLSMVGLTIAICSYDFSRESIQCSDLFRQLTGILFGGDQFPYGFA